MKIVFLYAGGRSQRVEALQTKRTPTEFFYGAIELAQLGHAVDFLEIPATLPVWAGICNVLFKGILPVRTSGDDIVGVGQLLRRLRDADCIVATTTAIALSLASWKKMGCIRPPIVGIHCGILNYPPRGVKRWITRVLLRGKPMIFFARPEMEAAQKFFGLPDIFEVPFGVDTDFWCPADFEGSHILSLGSDSRRDYGTFIDAARQCSLPIKILTSCPLPDDLPLNVSVLRGSWKNPVIDDVELLHLYRKSRFVVIPLHDSIQPSGQSVALQAMACGRPVIITHTSGLWTDQNFKNKREIILVPEKNSTILAREMVKLWDDPAQCAKMGAFARQAVLRTGMIQSFANGILECCRREINKPVHS